VAEHPLSPRSGQTVRLHLSVHLADGTEVLSTFAEEPIRCRIGDGTLAPGLEHLLEDLLPGADETFLVDGSELYGSRDEANIHWVSRNEFPAHLEPLEVGQVIGFTTPRGDEIGGVVIRVEPERAQMDLNHPLAGRPLLVRAEILEVSAPDTESPD